MKNTISAMIAVMMIGALEVQAYSSHNTPSPQILIKGETDSADIFGIPMDESDMDQEDELGEMEDMQKQYLQTYPNKQKY